MTVETGKKTIIDELFKAGAHFGFVKARRHPSAKPFLFGTKDKIEIFDLEKTSVELEKVMSFMEEKGREETNVMFVGGKNEAREATRKTAESLEMPYVAGRWIGGTLTNFTEIKKRLGRLEELTSQKEKGELSKYTKKERLLIDRDIDKLTLYFGGLVGMKSIPKFLVVIDPKKESIAVSEAKTVGIPVVALAGSDCNLHGVNLVVPGNDSSRQSISLFLNKLAESYKKGLVEAEKKKAEGDTTNTTEQSN
ncbi:MAG: 30S ribosomal protein S2 [Parcubacteria group bacterium]